MPTEATHVTGYRTTKTSHGSAGRESWDGTETGIDRQRPAVDGADSVPGPTAGGD
jgi:hypothetical protein